MRAEHELYDQARDEDGVGVPVCHLAHEARRGGLLRPERRLGMLVRLHQRVRARVRVREASLRRARRGGGGVQARAGGVRQEADSSVGYGMGLPPWGAALRHFS